MSENQTPAVPALNPEPAAAPAPKPALTPEQRLQQRLEKAYEALEKAQAAYDAVRAEVDIQNRLSNLSEGDKIRVRIPKGDPNGVWAVITGRRDGAGSVRFKVYYGEGFDSQVAVITPGQILEVLGEQHVG